MENVKGATPYYDNGLGIVYVMESGEIIVLNSPDCRGKQLNDAEEKNAEDVGYISIDIPEFGRLALYPEIDGVTLVPVKK